MKHYSYWETKHFIHHWDTLIIGSGITGLTTGIFLKRKFPNWKVAILERGVLPSGASTRNAGFACFGSVSEILDDLTTMHENEVFDLVAKRYEGLNLLRELLSDDQLDYKPTGGFEVFRKGNEEIYRECLGSLSYINAELVQCIRKQAFKDSSNLIESFGFSDVDNMIVNELEGTVDTGLMMKNLVSLARESGVEIFNGIEVKALDSSASKCVLDTNIGEILSKRTIVATNGFAKQLLPEAEVEPCRAQVLITSPIKNLKWSGSFHHDRGYDYFRDIDGRVLLGGGRHLAKECEQTDQEGTTAIIQDHLEKILREVILPEQEFKIDMRWSGTMGMGSSKKYIAKKLNDRVYCAVRFGGMGVALASSVSKSLVDLID
ncbi:FAD-dependent oxidoreductase [Cryomorphaceae bacterium 1068]|nr:FAD-dependent oxidoreductase [Cryomorphaceae bacterium 1068]